MKNYNEKFKKVAEVEFGIFVIRCGVEWEKKRLLPFSSPFSLRIMYRLQDSGLSMGRDLFRVNFKESIVTQ